MGFGSLQLTFYSVVTLGSHLLAAWLAAPHVNVQVPPVSVRTPDVVCSCECPAAAAASYSFAAGIPLGALLGLLAAAIIACLAGSACCPLSYLWSRVPDGAPPPHYQPHREARPVLALAELPPELRGDVRRAATPATLRKQ